MSVLIAEKSLGSDYMELQIKKRTGELVPFDKDKIKVAICKAYKEIYTSSGDEPFYAQEIANMVESVGKEMDSTYGISFKANFFFTISQIGQVGNV